MIVSQLACVFSFEDQISQRIRLITPVLQRWPQGNYRIEGEIKTDVETLDTFYPTILTKELRDKSSVHLSTTLSQKTAGYSVSPTRSGFKVKPEPGLCERAGRIKSRSMRILLHHRKSWLVLADKFRVSTVSIQSHLKRVLHSSTGWL